MATPKNRQNTIQLLPPELTNQIAAGEVVERPASVLKELVENALDAQATEIVVNIENGGQSLISVQDNGIGIAQNELELAVTRHATSKLHDIAGLSQIASYGFRGEALPSIASVSSFRIVSRHSVSSVVDSVQTDHIEDVENPDLLNSTTDNEAAELCVLFGKVESVIPSAWKKGTLIEVRDLFFNIPARLKFLKTPATELKKSTDLFVRLALVAKNVTLSLYAGSRLVHEFHKKEGMKERLAHIWPPIIVEALLPVNYKANGIHVKGFISHPRSTQPRTDRMLYYVNDRAVSDKILMRATRQAFQGKLTTRDYPQCFLCINLAPDEVDVNVHPAKNEVRFRDEQNVFVTVMRAISMSLEKDTSQFSAKNLMLENSKAGTIGALQGKSTNIQESTQGSIQENIQGLLCQSSPILGVASSIGKDLLKENTFAESPTQEARLGDLYQPKPKGFWGDMDKEKGLAFVKEEAERKRQFAQTGEWSAGHDYSLTDQNSATDSHASRDRLEEGYTPIAPLPEDFNVQEFKNASIDPYLASDTSVSSTTVASAIVFDIASSEHSFSREQEQLTHARNASLSLPAGLVYLGQVAKTYLVLQQSNKGVATNSLNGDSLILLDQHAVHERILYEEAQKGLVNAQNLLVPIEFPLHKSEQKRLEEVMPTLEKLAFKIHMSQHTCKVLAIPATLNRVDATGFLKDVMAQKVDDLEKIWISHACKHALKANTELDTPSALKLILRWLETEEPDYCPHGRPCVLHFDASKLEQMFKR